MGTRFAASQQDGGVAPAAGKPKALDVGNRRALGDIGNVVRTRAVPVVEGKPLPNRPITRRYCAQLLANAQESTENPTVIPVEKPIEKHVVAKAAPNKKAPKQKVNVKPKPESVIEISPDVIQGDGKKSQNLKHSRKGSSRPTLTSVLTARSQTASGIIGKALDIDAADSRDQLAVVEYIEDIYKYYKLTEVSSWVHDYMESQPEINDRMRAILADWLIEVHNRFELTPETLYLTFHILDRFLSVKTVLRRELQLVGISAMLIACKYEEVWAPEINDFVCISDQTYTREQILRMEKLILNKLEWSITVPTPYVFLVRFIKAAKSDKEMEHMTFFFAELALVQYSMIMYCPSMIAASAIYAAQWTLKKSPLWTETLKIHTGFSEPQLMDCAKVLVGFHSMAAESKLRAIHKKYSSLERSAVALHPPAMKHPEERER